MKQLSSVVALALAELSLLGCGNEPAPVRREAPQASAPALPANLFVATAPAGAKPLGTVRGGAKVGDDVTFTGYIGGRVDPFTEGRAIFLVADQKAAPQCSDGCETPWDSCCTPKEEITANSATVQVVDKDGAVVKLGLRGQNGMKDGTQVAITGKVREAVAGGPFVVDAFGISLQP